MILRPAISATIAALSLIGLLASATVLHSQESTEHVAAESEGRELYVRYGCYQCHGYEGQGGLLSGPRIAPEPLPLSAFTEIMRRPYGVMPAYSENVISDETLHAIHRYLQSINAGHEVQGLQDQMR